MLVEADLSEANPRKTHPQVVVLVYVTLRCADLLETELTEAMLFGVDQTGANSIVRTDEGKLYLFVAIDRISKFVFAELHERSTRPIAVAFLKRLISAVPYRIHTILTDNSIQFANRTKDKYAFKLLFDRICDAEGIEHRLTMPNHPWTNGQVERMNRTLKDTTVHRYFYETHQQLRDHLSTFLAAYNFAKRLKTLNGLTPYEYICRRWEDQPERFHTEPSHLTLGLYT